MTFWLKELTLLLRYPDFWFQYQFIQAGIYDKILLNRRLLLILVQYYKSSRNDVQCER